MHSTVPLAGIPRGMKPDHSKGATRCKFCPSQEEQSSSLLRHRWRKAVSLAQAGRRMMRWHQACGR